MKKLWVTIFILSFSWCAQADLIDPSSAMDNLDEVIIEDQYVAQLVFEEPSFGNKSNERDLASLVPESRTTEAEWLGQLMVLKEIPYSYAQLSHHTLQLRTLAEIEQEEQKKEKQ